jgi:hypothetical protein
MNILKINRVYMIVIWTYSPEEQNEEMKNVGDQLQE